jgi:hypothetical protein
MGRDKKPSLRRLSPSQWFYVVTPSVAGAVAAWLGRKELAPPEPLYIFGGGVGVSLLLVLVMVHGDALL